MKVGPSGHAKLEARLVRKYGGFKQRDPDKDEEGNTYTSRTAHPDMMFFHKQHGHNRYMLFALMNGFDMTTPISNQSSLWETWDIHDMKDDFYDLPYDFYGDKKDPKSRMYRKTDNCDSEANDLD